MLPHLQGLSTSCFEEGIFKKFVEALNKLWVVGLASINAGPSLCLQAEHILSLEIHLGAHQEVVCVTVCALIAAGEGRVTLPNILHLVGGSGPVGASVWTEDVSRTLCAGAWSGKTCW